MGKRQATQERSPHGVTLQSLHIMTTPQPSISSETRMLQQGDSAKQFAQEHWNRAAAVLSARPSLMTRDILMVVLKNNPPSYVVEFMLQLNPHAADVPSQGPSSPLQVAVRHNASVQVCALLIQACPLALVATHSGYDPLMYAKIWRREEPELLALLSRPLSYWVEQEKRRLLLVGGEALSSTKHTRQVTFPRSSNNNNDDKSLSPKSTTSSRSLNSTSSSMNDEEMNNIKKIAATIIRSQKKQVAHLHKYRQQVDQTIQQAHDKNNQERLAQLQKLQELQQRHFKAQLIALDMKEKRIMARVKKMERQVAKRLEWSQQVRDAKDRRHDISLQRVERNVESVSGSFEAFQARTFKQLEVTELRLNQELKVNDYFRSDVRLQLDQLDLSASALQGWSVGHDNGVNEMTPVVYATPYVMEDNDGEGEEYDSAMPLCPQAVPHRESGSCARNKSTKRSYPKRKRRHLLGSLHF